MLKGDVNNAIGVNLFVILYFVYDKQFVCILNVHNSAIGEIFDVSWKLNSLSSVLFSRLELPSKIETLKHRLCWYKLDETFCMLKWFSNQTIWFWLLSNTMRVYQCCPTAAMLLAVEVLVSIVEFVQFGKSLFAI